MFPLSGSVGTHRLLGDVRKKSDGSLAARALLIEIMFDYRGPGTNNGTLAWSCRRVAAALGVSKTTGALALTELELKGWLVVVRVAGLASRNKPAEYALTMFPNDATGDPASRAFEHWTPVSAVRERGRDGPPPGTRASVVGDTAGAETVARHSGQAFEPTDSFRTIWDVVVRGARQEGQL
jgi:hypothetical protein